MPNSSFQGSDKPAYVLDTNKQVGYQHGLGHRHETFKSVNPKVLIKNFESK